MLPILTFDSTRLTPSMGYVFDPKWLDPYESIVGMLWKFARANAVAGHTVVGQLTDDPVDVYAGVAPTRNEIAVPRVARLLRVGQKDLSASLDRETGYRWNRATLTWCGSCLRRGHHAIVHQRGPPTCAVHNEALQDRCSRCGFENPYRLTARLFDAPFRCPACRRPYAGSIWSSTQRRAPLKKEVRIAMTRAYFNG